MVAGRIWKSIERAMRSNGLSRTRLSSSELHETTHDCDVRWALYVGLWWYRRDKSVEGRRDDLSTGHADRTSWNSNESTSRRLIHIRILALREVFLDTRAKRSEICTTHQAVQTFLRAFPIAGVCSNSPVGHVPELRNTPNSTIRHRPPTSSRTHTLSSTSSAAYSSSS